MTFPTLHKEGQRIARADDGIYPVIGRQDPDRILPSHPEIDVNDRYHGLRGENLGFEGCE